MKRIAIIGAGVVGSVAAFYLSQAGLQVDVYDESQGQATQAAVGIICPWISQRRNMEWYQLVEDGAQFYHQLMIDVEDHSFYTQSGSLHLHKNLDKLYQLALKRHASAKIMGDVQILEGESLKPYLMEGVLVDKALYIEGSACVDGARMVETLLTQACHFGARHIHKKVFLDATQPLVIDGVGYDGVIVSAGAWMSDVFQHLPLSIDVYPQKGQLIEYPHFFDIEEKHYPFIIPQGELDIMFDLNGSLIIGASHENEKGFDLKPDDEVLHRLHQEAIQYLPFLKGRFDYQSRVGTRAHSSDFNPFYGELPQIPNLYVASALGSSGLTSGPIIGYRLAQAIIHNQEVEQASRVEAYVKSIS